MSHPTTHSILIQLANFDWSPSFPLTPEQLGQLDQIIADARDILDSNIPTHAEVQDLWAAIDPCAFLCYAVQINALSFDPAITQTLDAFGWLDHNQQPDYDKMGREFARYAKK